MVEHPDGPPPDNADDVQDLAMRNLPPGASGSLPREIRDRVFSIRSLRIHNRHIQEYQHLNPGEPLDLNCRCLREGLAGFLPETESQRGDPPGLVSRDRIDAAKRAAPPPDRRTDRGPDHVPAWT